MKLLSAALVCLAMASTAQAADISARYGAPEERYDHDILGDTPEWTSVTLTVDGRDYSAALPKGHLFEDITPHLIQGAHPAAVVVETDITKGSQVAIYAPKGGRLVKVANTPYIGTPHRWYSMVGVADLNGNGAIEVAFIDRPHLAKVLRIWRWDGARFTEIAAIPDLTNHQIGWNYAFGGLRSCGGTNTLIVASGDWSKPYEIAMNGGKITKRQIAPKIDPARDYLSCH